MREILFIFHAICCAWLLGNQLICHKHNSLFLNTIVWLIFIIILIRRWVGNDERNLLRLFYIINGERMWEIELLESFGLILPMTYFYYTIYVYFFTGRGSMHRAAKNTCCYAMCSNTKATAASREICAQHTVSRTTTWNKNCAQNNLLFHSFVSTYANDAARLIKWMKI